MPRKSPLRLGPKPERAVSAPKPRVKRKAAAKSTPPAVVEPTGPLAGFDQFDATDYAQPIARGAQTRFLTVSPLRAIMAEEAARDGEHVVTERTRQGVLYGAGLGIERKVLATILGIDLETLERLYADELNTAVHLMMNDVQTNLYNIARDPYHSGAVRAGMYMLGKLGNELYKDERKSTALTVNPQTRTIDPALLSEDQRDALREILTSALRLAGGHTAQPALIEGEYDEVDDEDAEDVL